MSKKIKILITVLIVLTISVNVSIIKHRIDEEKRKNEEYKARINHSSYLLALGQGGDEAVYSGDMKDRRIRFNENELMVRVAYYNGVMENTGEDVITTDNVKRYYQEYLDGDSTNLVSFCNIVLGRKENIPNKNYDGNSIDDFKEIVSKKLDDNVTISTATPEQMEEAIKKTMSEYETGKYRDAVDSPLDLEEDK